jgi:hypothetical protein
MAVEKQPLRGSSAPLRRRHWPMFSGSRHARLQWRSLFGTTPGERVMSHGLSKLYQEWLSGDYDCLDRIVLNAYFGMGRSPGGFPVWWRTLTGSDALDNAHLMRLAAWCRRASGSPRSGVSI